MNHHVATLQDEEGYSPPVGSIPYLIRFTPCDWNAVISRAQSHPLEVQLDQYGETVFRRRSMYASCPVLTLVLLFHRPPSHAVRALIRACPRVLLGHWGLAEKVTPLQAATCMATPPQPPTLLELLLQEHLRYIRQQQQQQQQSREDSFWFENPLRFMNHVNCTPKHVELFLRVYPEGATSSSSNHNKNGGNHSCSPLDEVLVRTHYRHTIDLTTNHVVWKKLLLYIQAATTADSDHDDNDSKISFFPVHYLLRRILFNKELKLVLQRALGNGLRVVPALQRLAREQPECFTKQDHQGYYPLDVLLLEHYQTHQHIPMETKQELVDMMVSMHPASARRRLQKHSSSNNNNNNNKSRWPLHWALDHGWPWRSIFYAAPQALVTRDEMTRLYPFQIAAAAAANGKIHSLDVIYNVLLQDPTIATYFGIANDANEDENENKQESIKQD